MRRGPAVLLLLCLLLASAYGSQWALSDGWSKVTSFKPVSANLPNAGPPPLANRLVVVLTDGLLPEEAPLLPSIEWIGRQGMTLRLSVPNPSHRPAAVATLLTGARPTTHGILFGASQALRGDNLLASARRARLTVGGVGSPQLGALLGSNVEPWVRAGTAEQLIDSARQLVANSGMRVVLLEFPLLHESKDPPGSTGRKERLAELDALLIQALQNVDLKTTAVAVIGLPPERGGVELVPVIMAGPGIKGGVHGTASAEDIAPTIAAVLGIPTPVLSQGRPLLEMLQVTGRPGDVVMQQNLAARRSYAEAALQRLGSRQNPPDPPTTAQGAGAYLQTTTQQIDEASFLSWKAQLMGRLPWLGGILLILLVYLIAAWRQPFGGALLWGTLTYVGLFHVIFLAMGGRYTAASAGLSSTPRQALTQLAIASVVAMCAAAGATGFALSRRGFKIGRYLMSAGLHMALSTAVVLSIPVIGTLAFVGWEMPLQLPAPGLLIWFFATAVQVMVIGYLGLFWGVLSARSTHLSAKLWPAKEIGDPERNADKVVRLRALRHSSTPHKR